MLWYLIGTAFAYPEIRLAPSSIRVVEDYQIYKKEKGKFTSDLACEKFAEGLMMCFRYVKKENLPYVLENDLKKWDATTEQLLISASDSSAEYVTKERYTMQEIDNVPGGYWASARKDGWDSAALLHPKRLELLLGAKPLVAVPQSGMFLFWREDNPQLNKAVAVGVKEIYNQSSHPVSPYIYHWSQGKWLVWGEAVEQKK
jgi:hypothetical protein